MTSSSRAGTTSTCGTPRKPKRSDGLRNPIDEDREAHVGIESAQRVKAGVSLERLVDLVRGAG
jgi:hypothetical protein